MNIVSTLASFICGYEFYDTIQARKEDPGFKLSWVFTVLFALVGIVVGLIS